MLTIQDLTAAYGQNVVLRSINFCLLEQESLCVLGRNGMGKTTLFRAITKTDGVLASGTILFQNVNLVKQKTEEIARLGIAYVPQGRRIFPSLTVQEHLRLAQQLAFGKEKVWNLDRIYEIFPELRKRAKILAERLSGGEQSMLAISRALLRNPRLLLLDEPSEGLAPIVINKIIEVCKILRNQKMSLLLAEQNLKVAQTMERVVILQNGTITFSGSWDDLLNNISIKSLLE